MNESTDRCLPGERRPGESAKAFQAVRLYLEMGPGRSQSAVATRLGKQLSQIQRWATRWGWLARAFTYDEHLASEAQLLTMNALREKAAFRAQCKEEHRQKELQLWPKLIVKIEQMLLYPLATTTSKDGQTIIQPARWGFRDIQNLLSAAAKLSEQAFKDDDEESLLRDESFEFVDYKADEVIA